MHLPNLFRRLTAVAVQLSHVEKKGISNIAKSSYYRAAIILICTVVESVVYMLAKEYSKEKNYVVDEEKQYQEIQKLCAKSLNSSNDLFVCEKKKITVHIDDEGVTFAKLNLYLLHKSVINNYEYEELNKVRIERNRLHLQGLISDDTGYTKKKFNSIADILLILLGKLSDHK